MRSPAFFSEVRRHIEYEVTLREDPKVLLACWVTFLDGFVILNDLWRSKTVDTLATSSFLFLEPLVASLLLVGMPFVTSFLFTFRVRRCVFAIHDRPNGPGPERCSHP